MTSTIAGGRVRAALCGAAETGISNVQAGVELPIEIVLTPGGIPEA